MPLASRDRSETYQWLLVPGQPDPKGAMDWSDIRLQGQDALAVRASKKMKNDMLLLTQMGGNTLRLELDRIPLWRGDHVSLKQLAEDLSKYLYLPRLKDWDVLLGAVRDGVGRLTWQSEAFAYAEKYDEQRGRYVGLQAGQALQVLINNESVLVKPDVAAKQLEVEHQERLAAAGASVGAGNERGGAATSASGASTATGTGVTGGTVTVLATKPRRFHGSVALDPLRVGRDASRIAEEILQHLQVGLTTTLKVTLEIEAEIPAGASDDTVRTVNENCRTLKFQSHGFEEH